MVAAIPFPNISPEIFAIEIGGFGFALRWYAMAYIVGILAGWWMAGRALRNAGLWRDNQAAMTREQLEGLVTWVIIGIVLGGRIGFVLFYLPAYYLANPGDILKLWEGGMAFHGGMLGVLFGTIYFCRRHEISLVSAGDLLCYATPPGILLGRLANFINGELWGKPTTAPIGVVFPGAQAQDCPAEFGVPCARHASQLYEAALEGLALGLVLIWLAYARRGFSRPGLVAGTFFAGYGVARFFVEIFRQADAQFITPENPVGYALQLGGTGLQMGQLLSLPMVFVGLVFIMLAVRRA